jgi:prepilin-type N-terminal cleavage/methylation domain-containing protein
MMRYKSQPKTRSLFLSNSGFTMIEILIAMAISTIVLTAVIEMYLGLTSSYTTESARAGAQQDLRDGMAIIVQDIRHAGLDPLGTAGGGFTINTASDITITADLDYDGGLTPNNNEQIRYFLNGDQLIQRLDGDNTTDEVLIDNVSALNFSLDGATTTTVIITMTVQAPAGRRGNITRTLTERVRVRNI